MESLIGLPLFRERRPSLKNRMYIFRRLRYVCLGYCQSIIDEHLRYKCIQLCAVLFISCLFIYTGINNRSVLQEIIFLWISQMKSYQFWISNTLLKLICVPNGIPFWASFQLVCASLNISVNSPLNRVLKAAYI